MRSSERRLDRLRFELRYAPGRRAKGVLQAVYAGVAKYNDEVRDVRTDPGFSDRSAPRGRNPGSD